MLAQGRKKLFRSIILHCRLLLAGALLLALVLVTPAVHARPRPDYTQFVTIDADGHFVNEHGPFLGYGTNFDQFYTDNPQAPNQPLIPFSRAGYRPVTGLHSRCVGSGQ